MQVAAAQAAAAVALARPSLLARSSCLSAGASSNGETDDEAEPQPAAAGASMRAAEGAALRPPPPPQACLVGGRCESSALEDSDSDMPDAGEVQSSVSTRHSGRHQYYTLQRMAPPCGQYAAPFGTNRWGPP